MKFRKQGSLLALVALATIAALLISACAGLPAPAPAPQQEAAAPAAQEAAPAAEEQAAAPAESTGEKIRLRLFTFADAAGKERVDAALVDFMADNPNIEVVQESVGGSGAAIYPDMLKTSMAAGDPPDVFWMWGGEIAGPFVDADQVLEIGSYYEKYNWDEILAPWTVESVKRNGGLYGVPRKAMGMGFWYRTDIFENLGLEVPTTFAEQEAVCETLKANDIYCVTVGGKFGWHTMRILDYFLEHTCGPEMHSRLNRLEESWDQQCVVEAYGLFQKWIDNGWVVPDFLTVSPDDSRWPWYKGEAALILEGVWYEGVLKTDEQDGSLYDFYLPPTDHEPVRFSAFPEQFMISKGSKHPDEAAALVDWLIRPENQQKHIQELGTNSPTIGVQLDCEEWPLTCKWQQILLTSTDTYPPTDQAFVKELMDGFFEVQDNIVAGNLTPEEGAKLFQQRIDEFQASKGQ